MVEWCCAVSVWSGPDVLMPLMVGGESLMGKERSLEFGCVSLSPKVWLRVSVS